MSNEAVPVNSFYEANEIEKESMPTPDEEILSLSYTPGWGRVSSFIDELISQRKTGGLRDGELPETYGARRLADDEAVKELERVKTYVNAIRKHSEQTRG